MIQVWGEKMTIGMFGRHILSALALLCVSVDSVECDIDVLIT